jgi:DNA-directed RNA polymerase specialized sigma24 family protein
LTHPEAAEALGVAVGTLKTRLYRGLGRLREMLGEDADPGAAAAKEGA